jgi:hypothetical protein
VHWTNSDGEDEIVTAPLDGTILEGVTRQAVIDTLVKDGFNVQQRKYTMPELCLAVKEGRVKEVFSSGTAVTVTPVKEIVYNGGWHILLLLLLLLLLDRCHPSSSSSPFSSYSSSSFASPAAPLRTDVVLLLSRGR